MWIIRLVLVGLLVIVLIASGYLLSHRKRYQNLLENLPLNLALVIVYSLLCYLLTGLPSDKNVFSPPAFFVRSAVRIGLLVVGLGTITAAVILMGVTLRQRKTLGGQSAKGGLLISGVYRHFRHPLYVGAILVSLGIALVTSSWDGLLMVPVVLAANVVEALVEERYDMGMRFQSQYQEYRRKTRMLGPIWVWASLVGMVLAVVLVPNLLCRG